MNTERKRSLLQKWAPLLAPVDKSESKEILATLLESQTKFTDPSKVTDWSLPEGEFLTTNKRKRKRKKKRKKKMDNSDKLKIGYSDNKLPMTEVEKNLLTFIDWWHDDHMKYFTDLQYAKGKFKTLATEAREMIEKRNS